MKFKSPIIILLAAAALIAACGDDVPGPEPYDGPWKVVPCPDGPSYVNGVFFLNPNLGYAVGCDYILKYDGTAWKVDYKYPEKEGRKLGYFHDVSFTEVNNGWVAGGWYDEEQNLQKGLIMYYDGIKWEEVRNIPGSILWDSVFFLDKNNGWVGGYGIARWDGTSWTRETDIGFITDMYFNSPTDGWAVSKYDERVYHYDGTTWTKVHEEPWGIELSSVWFTSPDHGWAGGDGANAGTESCLLEYKNGRWGYYLGEPWLEGIRRTIRAVHFSAPDNGWAMGQNIFGWDGNKWRIYFPNPPAAKGVINDVYTISNEDAWAVGEARTIMHYQP